jgi:hypothetical protein
MDSVKILLLIPGLIYGVGLVDLLKVFKPNTYWEIRVMAILLFLTLIINWFLYADRISATSLTLGIYTLTMVSPLLFTRACNVLTPDINQQDTKSHFFNVRKSFFLILGIHTLVNIFLQFIIYEDGLNIFRVIAILLLFACAYFDKLWVRTIMMVTFMAIFIYIFSTTEISL